jgi:preprotein translocase subunit SecD
MKRYRLEFLIVEEPGREELVGMLGEPPPGVEIASGTVYGSAKITTSYYFKSVQSEGVSGRELMEKVIEAAAVPEGRVLALGSEGPRLVARTWLLRIPDGVVLSGDHVVDADVEVDPGLGTPYAKIRFNEAGEKLFAKLTGENVDRRMAIVLDGTVQIAPVIKEKITGGRARVMLGVSPSLQETEDLVHVLGTGSLPAPLVLEIETLVGPASSTK